MKELGLVGTTGQLRHFLASIIVAGGGRGHGGRQKLSRKARPTEQTGSVRRKQQCQRRKQQCHSKNRGIVSMWVAVARIATRERKRQPSLVRRCVVYRGTTRREERGGSELQLQPTWIREMGKASQIGARSQGEKNS